MCTLCARRDWRNQGDRETTNSRRSCGQRLSYVLPVRRNEPKAVPRPNYVRRPHSGSTLPAVSIGTKRDDWVQSRQAADRHVGGHSCREDDHRTEDDCYGEPFEIDSEQNAAEQAHQ